MGNLEFKNSWILVFAIALVPLAYLLYRKSVSTVVYSSLSLVSESPRSLRRRFLFVPPALMAGGLLGLIIALAGPRTPDHQTRIRRDGIAIMLVVDRSGSMNARDLVEDDRSIDRLSVVKNVLRDFILGEDSSSGRQNDMIGLVTFAGYADSICPLTFDHQNLVTLIGQVEIADSRSEDGTAMGDGLALAVERLRQSEAKSRVIIFLTDGVNNAGIIEPLKAAEVAAEFDIKVYSIGAGTRGMAPIPMIDPFTRRTVLRAAQVQIDEESLKSIAAKTGGEYFRATDASTLTRIYGEINRLERTEVSKVQFLRYTEYFESALVIGMLLVGLAAILDRTFFRRLP